MLGRATIPRRVIFRNARARRARVDATSKHPCPAQVHKAAPSIPDGAVALAVRKVRKSVKYRTQFDILKCNPAKKVHAMAAPLLPGQDKGDSTSLQPAGPSTPTSPSKFLATHLLGNAAAPRRVDFFKVAGIPDRVENPYLFPPWAYATTPDGKKTALKEVEAGIGTLFGAGKKGK
ncbi:hypothetical protein JL722_12479 [Aureococcus anophagefferens]|nr:hypothetical protein JL722_12479 [Aureococcus anophagefferens]